MKKKIFFLLTISNLAYGSNADQEPKKYDNLGKKGIVLVGMVGGCIVAKRNWSSISWVTKKTFKNEIGEVKNKLDTILSDISVLKRTCLENFTSIFCNIEDAETRLGNEIIKSAAELKALRQTIDQVQNNTIKILKILEKDKA